MKTNLDIKQLKNPFTKAVNVFQRYKTFIFVITILCIYTFLVFQIGALTRQEPSEEAILEKANTVKRLKIDEDEIEKIQQLEDQNIGVQTMFESARENPFRN